MASYPSCKLCIEELMQKNAFGKNMNGKICSFYTTGTHFPVLNIDFSGNHYQIETKTFPKICNYDKRSLKIKFTVDPQIYDFVDFEQWKSSWIYEIVSWSKTMTHGFFLNINLKISVFQHGYGHILETMLGTTLNRSVFVTSKEEIESTLTEVFSSIKLAPIPETDEEKNSRLKRYYELYFFE